MDKFTSEEVNEAICNNVCKCCKHYNEGAFSEFCKICQVSEVMQIVALMKPEDKDEE